MIRVVLSAVALATIGAAATPVLTRADQTRLSLDKRTGNYCTRSEVVTGSIMPQRECHSVADWAARGLTIPSRTVQAATTLQAQG